MYFSLPKEYRETTTSELKERIRAAKELQGRRLCILVHHYQRMEVVEFADFLGDSYDLSKRAANQKEAEIVIFCGVYFMAEAADILTSNRQQVYLANPLAGCPMADMAEMADVLEAWHYLKPFGGAERIMPLSYMNTTAGLKAFTGRNGGLICTSSNARQALEYAFARRDKAFFFPDENLGMNTGRKMGLKPEEMIVWDFSRDSGGLTERQVSQAKLILWKGHCHVHTNFTPEHVRLMRERHPEVQIIVHPECIPEVVDLADGVGSTRYLVDYCAKAPSGSVIAIGTEVNLIHRMSEEYPNKTILQLSGDICPVCANMYRTTLNDLAYCLDHYADIRPVSVSESDRSDALVALERMLEIGK